MYLQRIWETLLPSLWKSTNNNDDEPHILFYSNHQDMSSIANEWKPFFNGMKSIIVTLSRHTIYTFSVGYNQQDGNHSLMEWSFI